MQLIDKDVIMTEMERLIKSPILYKSENVETRNNVLEYLLSYIDTLEVKDPYKQCVQYDSIKAGIQAHAETYSFNIQSELFNQLTKEQQKLWRKEIEQACISGGDAGVKLARDIRYRGNDKVKEVDLEKDSKLIANGIMISVQANKYGTNIYNTERNDFNHHHLQLAARKGIELGLKAAQKGE